MLVKASWYIVETMRPHTSNTYMFVYTNTRAAPVEPPLAGADEPLPRERLAAEAAGGGVPLLHPERGHLLLAVRGVGAA